MLEIKITLMDETWLAEKEAVAEFLHEPDTLPPVGSGNLEMFQEEPG